MAEALNADIVSVPSDARVGDFEPWDSLVHLRLILALEEVIQQRLDPDEIVAIESLNDIEAILLTKTPIR